MSSYIELVERELERIPCNELIIASELYGNLCVEVSEQTFYKSLERLSKYGKLIHLTKSVYYRPRQTSFGTIPISEEEIADYYLRDNRGVLVGTRLYNHKGITTQIGKRVEILSTALNENKKNIQNVSIRRISAELNEGTIPAIETLEILQNYSRIEDLNKRAFIGCIENYVRHYSQSAVDAVLTSCRYKKSTIAFLAAFLDYLQIEHGLGRYLSSMSNYRIQNIEELYESAYR